MVGQVDTKNRQTWLPSPKLLTSVSANIKNKDEKTDAFVLSSPDMFNLLQFVSQGIALPVSKSKYCSALNISEIDIPEVVDEDLTTITGIYDELRESCNYFQESIWTTQMIPMARQVKAFADLNAGSDDTGVTQSSKSYYVHLATRISEYSQLQKTGAPKEKITTTAQYIQSWTKKLQPQAEALAKQSSDLVLSLDKFKTQCSKFSTQFTNEANRIQPKLQGNNGEIARLRKEISEQQNILTREQDEYHHDVVVAATTPTYAWCTIFGFIAAITVASIYGPKAVAMKNAIEATQKLISDDQDKLKADVAIDSDLTRMDKDLKRVNSLIDPAIKTVGELQAVWENVATTLKAIHDAVDDGGEVEDPDLKDLEKENVAKKWGELRDYIETFNKVAFVTKNPDRLTIQQWLEMAKRGSI